MMHVHTNAQQRVCKGNAVRSGTLRVKSAHHRCFQAPKNPLALSHRGLGSSKVVLRKTSNRGVLLAPRAVDVAAPTQPPPDIKVDVEDVTVVQVSRTVFCLRNTSADRVKYEIEFGLKRGSTDNSYLIKGGKDATVLIDVPLQVYAAKFGEGLVSAVDPASISHVVLTHIAPNRLEALKTVLRLSTQGRAGDRLQVFLTNPALQLVQSTFSEDSEAAPLLEAVDWVVARSGSTVQLPGGRELRAVLTPTPRWPDLMCIYDSKSMLLFTSKIFSAHVAPAFTGGRESAFDIGGWQAYSTDWQYYFDCMFAPVARQAAAAFEKLDIVSTDAPPASIKVQGLLNSWAAAFQKMVSGSTAAAPPTGEVPGVAKMLVKALAPMHGPVVKNARTQLLGEYRDWIEEQIKAADSAVVAVLYASAYGNTAALAQAISRGVTKGGVGVHTLNLEVAPLAEVAAAAQRAQGFVIGSPTLGGHMPTQVQAALGTLLKEPRAKELPCGVFGSFGWSGEAVDEMQGKLQNSGFTFSFDPIRVKFRPTAADLMRCEESGRNLAMAVKKRQKNRERATAGQVQEIAASGPQLAMGRVVGSLCVVTAKDDDCASAMLASWIAQASFTPPGLTVAVKKDRAMENLLMPGCTFAVSVLAEGKERKPMRLLSRPHAPGEDRLAGLPSTPGPLTGCPVLDDANSMLECKVVSRMEAGDHWVLYGEVLGGKLMDAKTLTAVHHRKVGNHY